MFAYLSIIQSAHIKFLGLSWLSYDIDFRRRAAWDPTLAWSKIDPQLYLAKFTGLSALLVLPVGEPITSFMLAHYLPPGRSQTLAVITTGETPVPGCPASMPTTAHTPTATATSSTTQSPEKASKSSNHRRQ